MASEHGRASPTSSCGLDFSCVRCSSQPCGVMASGVTIELCVKGESLLLHHACAKYGALYYSREREKRLDCGVQSPRVKAGYQKDGNT